MEDVLRLRIAPVQDQTLRPSRGDPGAALCDVARRADRGQIDADVGGRVIKQRIAHPGQGTSGGFRAIVLFSRGERSFFVYGFAKSGTDSLQQDELKAFRLLGGRDARNGRS